jgi:drug/metabolite transporter (DMT)-like permease
LIAILGGLGAALAFAGATLTSSRTSRLVGPYSVLTWVMLTGLIVAVPLLLLTGPGDDVGRGDVGWLAFAGVGNVVGLLLSYEALRTGRVGVVAPIVSTEGALAAVFSMLAGQSIELGVGVGLAVVTLGVVLSAIPSDSGGESRDRFRTPALAAGAAVCFGASLYAVGHISGTLSVGLALLPARLIGVVAVAVPLAAMRRVRITAHAAPLLILGGLFEVAGLSSFMWGARHDLAVSAVLSAQFAGLAALAAYFMFGEKFARLQVVGIALIASGVALVAALQ